MKAEWFGLRLKELRNAKKWTQQKLADQAGLKVGGVRDIEQGINNPTWPTILALCKALGVGCTAFTEEPTEQPKPKRGRPPKGTEDATEEAEKPAKKRTRKKRGE